ncbi:MAG: hypothetical protein KDA84_12845, partial [Planctomycetaceae bacterium]|nr:hypothetical protein [Planctomycetaceae bacterium]
MQCLKIWGLAVATLSMIGGGVASAQVGGGVFAFLDNSIQTGSGNSVERSVYAPAEDPSFIVNTSAECASGCGSECGVSCADTCCEPFGKHRHRVFVDYLFLSAMNTDLTYAIPVNGLGAQGTPTGAAAVVSPEYESGFRAGGGWAIDDSTSIVGTFWNFQSDNYDNRRIFPAAGGATQFLNPVLLDPNTLNVVAESSVAESYYDVDFRMVDLAVERLLSAGCSHAINAVVGVRYGRLEQYFRTNYAILGTTTLESNIDFDGIGPRLGLDGKLLISKGFFAYGQGFTNFLVGEFEGDFQQRNTFAGVQSNSSFVDDRIISILE